MKTKIKNMTVYVCNNYDEMSKLAANIIAAQVQLKPECILGLATGGTPVGMYKELVNKYKDGDINFDEVKTFNLDEYYPINQDNDQSYYYFMNENLFKHVNIAKENIHIPNGMTKDINNECKLYEETLANTPGIDLQVLGIGPNGHIGFNEPDVKFEEETHLVELDERTIKANSRFFNSIDEVPRQAISMGIGTIMKADKIMLLANGAGKAKIIKEMILGDITPKVPASVLKLHNNVTVILDKEAAKELSL